MHPMIHVQDLSKTFRVHRKEPGLKGSLKSLFMRRWEQVHALRNVSLSIEAGEIVGLVGANGAGKTTLVKALSGIIHPTSGSATVQGFVPWQRKDGFRKQISLIMGQKAQLWWDLPAGDSFLLLREVYRIPKKEFQEHVSVLAEVLRVQGKMNIQIRRLSLGERMKMELIAALLHKPRVVFLDEPTIGLDLPSQRAIREFILDYRKRENPAMILTSHYMEDIEKLCKRIILMRQGAVVYDGSVSEMVSTYARKKVVTLRLQREDVEMGAIVVPAHLGEVIQRDGQTLKIRVDRARAAAVAAHFLQQLPVADLSIDEEDIGTVIEAMLREDAPA